MTIKLKCGCEVTDDGKFVVGAVCKATGCKECDSVSKLHPFGKMRLRDLQL